MWWVFLIFALIQMIVFCFPSKLKDNNYVKPDTKKEQKPNEIKKEKNYEWQDWD